MYANKSYNSSNFYAVRCAFIHSRSLPKDIRFIKSSRGQHIINRITFIEGNIVRFIKYWTNLTLSIKVFTRQRFTLPYKDILSEMDFCNCMSKRNGFINLTYKNSYNITSRWLYSMYPNSGYYFTALLRKRTSIISSSATPNPQKIRFSIDVNSKDI